MFHGHLDYFQKPHLGGRLNTKLGDHGTLNAHNHWFILSYHVRGPAWREVYWNSIWWRPSHIWLHTTLEDPWPHYMILEVCWDGLRTLSFGLSQFHGHGSRLVCDVALNTKTNQEIVLKATLGHPKLSWDLGILHNYRVMCRVRQRGTNHGFDPSLRKVPIKSSLAHCVSDPILEVGWNFWDLFSSPQKIWDNFMI